MKKVCLLDNPISGSIVHTARVASLVARLTEQGFDVTCETLASFEQTRQVIEDQLQRGCDVFIVSGGDGTVRSVAQHLTGTRIPLLIFPSGNENLLASQFGLSSEPSDAVEVILRWSLKDIDVAQINGMICIAVAGVGVDAAIVHHVQRKRKGHISVLDYVWPTIKTFLSYRHQPIEICVDGQSVCDTKALAFIGNISRYGGGFKIFDNAVCDDGLLDLVIFKCRNVFQLLYLFLLAILGKTATSSLVRHFRGKDIILRTACETMKTQIDGEPGPAMPLEVKLIPKGLCLLVP